MPELILPRPEDLVPLLPGAALILVLLALGSFLVGRGHRGAGGFLAALAVPLGLVATHVRIKDWPTLPWSEDFDFEALASDERVALGVVTLGLGGGLAFAIRRNDRWSRFLQAGLGAGLVWFLLHRQLGLEVDEPGQVGNLDFLGLVGVTMLLWYGLEELAESVSGPLVPLAAALSFGAAGQLALEFGTASIGQLFGTASLGLLVFGFFCAFIGVRGLPVAATSGAAAAAAALGIQLWHFGTPPPPDARWLGILAFAPALVALTRLPRVRDLRPSIRVGGALLLVAALVSWGLFGALSERPEPQLDPNDPAALYGAPR